MSIFSRLFGKVESQRKRGRARKLKRGRRRGNGRTWQVFG